MAQSPPLNPQIVEFMGRHRFPDFKDIEGRLSIADLFPTSGRTGLYLLRFRNDEYYVGKTMNVVARFAAHRQRHKDIVAISFQRVGATKLGLKETSAIDDANYRRLPVRNVDGILDPIPQSDLDLLIAPEVQDRWLQRGERIETEMPKWRPKATPAALTRYRDLVEMPDWDQVKPLAAKYLSTCIPAPLVTERLFWTVSALPGMYRKTSVIDLIRFNIFWQETLFIRAADATSPYKFGLFVAESALPDRAIPVGHRLVNDRDEQFRWATGGSDQICLAGDYAELRACLDDADVVRAAKEFARGLMRKGAVPRNRAEAHCAPLVDDLLRLATGCGAPSPVSAGGADHIDQRFPETGD